MRAKLHWLIVIFLLLSAGAPSAVATAQTSAVTVRIDAVDTSQFPQVSIQLHAWDASGIPVPGLTSNAFSIVEDNGTSFHPAGVQSDTSAPLRVVLALDVSGSMAGAPLADAKVAAARFLDHLSANDQAALVAFSDRVNPDPAIIDPALDVPFTSNLTDVYDKIENLQAGHNTELYLALTKSVNMLARTSGDTRVILLLTDGRDEPPNVGTPEQPIQLAQHANIPVFAIGLGNKIDELYLRHLVNSTGGLLRTTPSSSELANLFGEMATLLKTRYVLSYLTTLPRDSQQHKLTVTVNILQGQSQGQTSFGPLPAAGATPLATSVAFATATMPPTIVVTPSVPSPRPEIASYWGWILAALIALGLGGLYAVRRRSRPQPQPEVCARCGLDLTGKPGPCPNCGYTRLLPRKP